jgi:hypothetical protein
MVALVAQPAAAAVTITPDVGTQGEGVEVAFTVVEDRPPAYTTRVEIRFPDSTPIAEIAPLSNDDWAPETAYRTIAVPAAGAQVAETSSVVGAISWIRVAARPSDAQPTAGDLRMSIGPLPRTANLPFVVVQQYSDGVVQRWTDPVMKLRPPAMASGQDEEGAEKSRSAAVANSSSDGHVGTVAAVLVALAVGLVAGGGWVAISRKRRGRGLESP